MRGGRARHSHPDREDEATVSPTPGPRDLSQVRTWGGKGGGWGLQGGREQGGQAQGERPESQEEVRPRQPSRGSPEAARSQLSRQSQGAWVYSLQNVAGSE